MANDPKQQPAEVQLQIQLDDDVANGRYVNLALVNHTETEFVVDYIYVQPQQPKAKVLSRIITSPRHMKRLVAAMQENLAKYEARFGVIELRDADGPVH
ncbi:MAG TPA: DUF3467 domain-containing protein [Myxococcaceae bacterium]|jgi:hypothetical protein|nr:DUF3467 domain-containing protein [Myxococcaceae bacterium]